MAGRRKRVAAIVRTRRTSRLGCQGDQWALRGPARALRRHVGVLATRPGMHAGQCRYVAGADHCARPACTNRPVPQPRRIRAAPSQAPHRRSRMGDPTRREAPRRPQREPAHGGGDRGGADAGGKKPEYAARSPGKEQAQDNQVETPTEEKMKRLAGKLREQQAGVAKLDAATVGDLRERWYGG
jgi:hypothetical protein